MKTSVILLLSVIALASCTREGTSPPSLPEKTLTALFAELLVVREKAALLNKDSTELKNSTDSLLMRYRITRLELEQALAPYKKNLKAWRDFYANVSQQLQKSQDDTLRGE